MKQPLVSSRPWWCLSLANKALKGTPGSAHDGVTRSVNRWCELWLDGVNIHIGQLHLSWHLIHRWILLFAQHALLSMRTLLPPQPRAWLIYYNHSSCAGHYPWSRWGYFLRAQLVDFFFVCIESIAIFFQCCKRYFKWCQKERGSFSFGASIHLIVESLCNRAGIGNPKEMIQLRSIQ